MDLYNLEIISFRISPQSGVGPIIMKEYQAILKEHEIFQSMSRKETCYDNSAIENFFGLMKQEMYYGKIY